MRRRKFRLLLAALAVGGAITAAAVLFSSSSSNVPSAAPTAGSLALGRQLFQDVARDNFRCEFCHAMRSAEASGVFAANLDQEFSLDRQQGFSDAKIRNQVLSYISNPPCFDPTNPNRCMPKDLYTGKDKAVVATFIAKCAGRSTTVVACRPTPGGLHGLAATGQRVYMTSGCPSCHWSLAGGNIGPSLDGVYASNVRLASGKTVVANTAYLLESILAPDAKIVRGYRAGVMSARLKPGEITLAQAEAIVSYIKTLEVSSRR